MEGEEDDSDDESAGTAMSTVASAWSHKSVLAEHETEHDRSHAHVKARAQETNIDRQI